MQLDRDCWLMSRVVCVVMGRAGWRLALRRMVEEDPAAACSSASNAAALALPSTGGTTAGCDGVVAAAAS